MLYALDVDNFGKKTLAFLNYVEEKAVPLVQVSHWTGILESTHHKHCSCPHSKAFSKFL